jgi:PAS domain S-box-containing protein
MLIEERSSFTRYSVALTIVGLATAARYALSPLLSDAVPFIFYFPAVVACAWFGGFGPGLLSVITSALIAWYVFLPLPYTFAFSSVTEPIQLVVFVATSIFCVMLAENLHRTRRRIVESERGEREERARLRVTLASIGDAVIATDERGRITLLNGVAEVLTGWKQAEAIGQDLTTVFRIVNEFTRKEVDNPIVKVLREGVIVGLANHTALIARDGREHPIADSGAPIKDDDGKIIGAVLVFRDITEGRDAEAATLQLAAIVASSEDGIISKTLDGVITSWNQAAEAMFGYTATEAIGQSIHLIIPPMLREEENRILARLRKGERVEHYETVRQRKGGTPIDVSLTVSPIKNSEGWVIGASKIIRDVTEQKRQDQTLRENDRRKDEFLAMLSHELRNPLAPIRNATHVLKLVGLEDENQRWACEVIERQTQHLTRLVDDLLDVSRITRGKVTLHIEPLDLTTIINRAVETSRPLIDARRHQLNVSLPPMPVHLHGDLTRLVQIIANLLNNAAKYTDEGGRIDVEARVENGEAVIRVRDNGIGLPPELLPHVFDLFRQADRSLDRSQGGLGIGLTLVRQLVDLHGGRVEAKSNGHFQGSEFIVHIPAVSHPVAIDETTSVEENAPLRLNELRVLVVEDHADSAESMALMLKLDGHEVQIADDGPKAMEIARFFLPQVVLCDIGLPGMNGYEMAAQLRAQPQFVGMRLIALTGYGQEEDRRRAKDAGFDHFLVKPINPEDLQALLETFRPDRGL